MSTPEPASAAELLPPEDPPKASPGTALTLPERARAAIGLVDIEAQLTELAGKTSSITVITNADGREQVHASAMALKQKRIAIQQAGKQARDDANKFASEVIVQQDKLIALIAPEEERLLSLRNDWDTARAEEKRLKAEAERKRQAEIQRRIQQDIRDVPAAMANRSAADIDNAIRTLVALQVDESFGEFLEVAQQAHANTLVRLRSMHAQRVEFEAEQQRQQQRKAELDAEIARQRQERTLNDQRLQRIQGIQQLPILATTGRAPDRKPGTRECIVAALEDARAVTPSEADFGSLYASAVASRNAAIQQIEHLLQRFDDREVERLRFEEQQRQQQEAAERQRTEQQRLEAERAAAQAEHARIAAENARQAEELRRQQAELEQQRLAQEAARVEFERQQQQVVAAPAPSPPAAKEVPAQSADIETQAAPAAAKEFAPSAEHLIALVAHEYGVSNEQAGRWCVAAFREYQPAS